MKGIVKDTIFNGDYGQIADEWEYKKCLPHYESFKNLLLDQLRVNNTSEESLTKYAIHLEFIRGFLGYKDRDLTLEKTKDEKGRPDLHLIKDGMNLMLGDMKGPKHRFDHGDDNVMGQLLRYRNNAFDHSINYKYFFIFSFVSIRFYLPDLYHYIHFDLMKLYYVKGSPLFERVEDVIDEEGLRILYWMASRDEIDRDDEDRIDFNRDVVKSHIDFLNKEVIEDEVKVLNDKLQSENPLINVSVKDSIEDSSEEVFEDSGLREEVAEESDKDIESKGKVKQQITDGFVIYNLDDRIFQIPKELVKVETIWGLAPRKKRLILLQNSGHLYGTVPDIDDSYFFKNYNSKKIWEFKYWYAVHGTPQMERDRYKLYESLPLYYTYEWKKLYPDCPFEEGAEYAIKVKELLGRVLTNQTIWSGKAPLKEAGLNDEWKTHDSLYWWVMSRTSYEIAKKYKLI